MPEPKSNCKESLGISGALADNLKACQFFSARYLAEVKSWLAEPMQSADSK
jgi:hypothetical protein